ATGKTRGRMKLSKEALRYRGGMPAFSSRRSARAPKTHSQRSAAEMPSFSTTFQPEPSQWGQGVSVAMRFYYPVPESFERRGGRDGRWHRLSGAMCAFGHGLAEQPAHGLQQFGHGVWLYQHGEGLHTEDRVAQLLSRVARDQQAAQGTAVTRKAAAQFRSAHARHH